MGPERRGDLDAIDIMRNYMDFHSSGNYELGSQFLWRDLSQPQVVMPVSIQDLSRNMYCYNYSIPQVPDCALEAVSYLTFDLSLDLKTPN